MRYSIGEIFNFLENAENEQEKISILESNKSVPLAMFLQYCLDKRVEFNLPKGEVPYRESNFPTGQANAQLLTQVQKLYIFVKKNPHFRYHKTLGEPFNPNAPEPLLSTLKFAAKKSGELFIGLLEDLDNKEAKLLCQVKDRKIDQVTAETVNKVWPNLIPPEGMPVEEDDSPKATKDVTSVKKEGDDNFVFDTTQHMDEDGGEESVESENSEEEVHWQVQKERLPVEEYEEWMLAKDYDSLDEEQKDEVRRIKRNIRKRNSRKKQKQKKKLKAKNGKKQSEQESVNA